MPLKVAYVRGGGKVQPDSLPGVSNTPISKVLLTIVYPGLLVQCWYAKHYHNTVAERTMLSDALHTLQQRRGATGGGARGRRARGAGGRQGIPPCRRAPSGPTTLRFG